MTSSTRLSTVWTAVLLTASMAAAERKVAMSDLPAAVQEAVRERTKGLAIVGIEEETEDGKTLYEVETKTGGKTRDMVFDATGKVVADEMEVALGSVPEAARTALVRAAGGGEITKVEAVTEDGITVYEAKIKNGGKTSEVVVGADGTTPKH